MLGQGGVLGQCLGDSEQLTGSATYNSVLSRLEDNTGALGKHEQHQHHGQGQPHLADQQHEVPGQDGEVAALQVYRRVSSNILILCGLQNDSRAILDWSAN